MFDRSLIYWCLDHWRQLYKGDLVQLRPCAYNLVHLQLSASSHQLGILECFGRGLRNSSCAQAKPACKFPLSGDMARNSSFLPLLLLAAIFVAPAFVPSAAPRSAPNAAAASVGAGMLPLLVVQPAMAEASVSSSSGTVAHNLYISSSFTLLLPGRHS